MSEFIQWLEGLHQKDTRVRAVLKRSLAFEPGQWANAYPYVEPFAAGQDNMWQRQMLYLVAGLWALHWREEYFGERIPIGKACAIYQVEFETASIERRFIALLDADCDQLPHRLRQMIALLKDQPVDFEHLLFGLQHWNDVRKRTQIQIKWAQDYYWRLSEKSETTPISFREETA